jgi:hypothetical protein
MFSIKKAPKVIISVVAFGLIAVLLSFVFFNISSPVSAVASGDIKAAYERGYNDYAGDLEYYKAKVEQLEQEIIDNRAAADERYNNMVAYYEGEIARLNNEIDVLWDYILYLESYLIELDFDFENGDNDSALLGLRLSAYTAIKEKYENDILNAQSVLDALPDLDVLNSQYQSFLDEVIYYSGLIDNYVYPAPWHSVPSYWDNSTYHGWIDMEFGSTLEYNEYSYSFYELKYLASNGRFRAIDGSTWLLETYPVGGDASSYWGVSNYSGQSSTQRARRELFYFSYTMSAADCSAYANQLVASYISYYSAVVEYYSSDLVVVNGYKQQRTSAQEQADSKYSQINDVIAQKAVQEYIISEAYDKLEIVNAALAQINDALEALNGGGVMKMSKKDTPNKGKVYWGESKFIDTDTKPRRRYVVVKDNGETVKVSKLSSLKKFDKDGKNVDSNFAEIKKYDGLTKRTGVLNRLFAKNKKTKEKLRIGKDNGVFDEKPIFELDDEDFEKVEKHIIDAKNMERKKFRAKKKGKH